MLFILEIWVVVWRIFGGLDVIEVEEEDDDDEDDDEEFEDEDEFEFDLWYVFFEGMYVVLLLEVGEKLLLLLL